MRYAPVILPDLGTGPDVPIVISYWFASRGELVWEGERLVEVLAGPATFDVPAPATGHLAEIRGREDDRVQPGSVLGLVATAEEQPDVDGPDDGLREGQDGSSDRDGGDAQPRRPTT